MQPYISSLNMYKFPISHVMACPTIVTYVYDIWLKQLPYSTNQSNHWDRFPPPLRHDSQCKQSNLQNNASIPHVQYNVQG